MNTLTTTSVVLPAPRPAINQGIDINNEMVLNHTAIYENCLAQVTQENTVENALMLLDPYGTAPLSAYAGVWSLEPAEIIVTVQDAAKTAMPVEHLYTLTAGANLLPVLGLVADTENRIVFSQADTPLAVYTLITQPLPPVDSAEVVLGFPIINVTQPATDANKMAPGFYFITHFDRYNYALDQNGLVRWYVTQDYPSYNFVRIDNGHFLTTSEAKNTYLDMYEFDMMGRLHTFYNLDNQFHHSIGRGIAIPLLRPLNIPRVGPTI